MARLGCVVALVLLWSSATRAADRDAIAVLDIQGTGVAVELLPTLTEILTVEIHSLGRYKVIAGRDIQAMLGFEKQKDVLGCTETACLAEIGGALGVDRIVAGHIGRVGNTFVVNIKLINIRSADTEGRVYETVKGEADDLIETLRLSVGKLFAGSAPQASAAAVGAGGAAAGAAEGGDAAARARTQKRLQVLARREAEAASSAPAADTEAAAPPVKKVRRAKSTSAMPGLFVVGGLVFGTVGVILGKKAQDQEKMAQDKTKPGSQKAAYEAPRLAKAATTAYVVGGACLLTGIIWGLASSSGESAESYGAAPVLPVVTPGGVGVAWSGSF